MGIGSGLIAVPGCGDQALNLRRESEVAAPLDGIRRRAVLLEAVASTQLETVIEALASHGAQAYLR